ncbi:hypothetical protein B9Z55_012626 [Caenorhabditis nigoni]|uniref:HAT C-terminal dimerisation domain-containing protein n=1 Tax=Caenorhabditis nigoni TaxID=1611254 RepID=A0A2G5TY22_9PELO|nr:hypothetical protein B9Z55_012626 [Caenorhabditis nigoni]
MASNSGSLSTFLLLLNLMITISNYFGTNRIDFQLSETREHLKKLTNTDFNFNDYSIQSQKDLLVQVKRGINQEFYQRVMPEVVCKEKVRIGEKSDGGKYVCKPESGNKEDCTRLIAEMIATDKLPLNFTAGRGFLNLMKHLQPRYRVKSRHAFSRTEIPEIHKELSVKLSNELKEAEDITLGFDLWSDDSLKQEVVGVIAYFLKNRKIEYRVIGSIDCKDMTHSGENIGERVKGLLKKYNIEDKVRAIVRDGASNVVKTCRLLEIPSFDCYNHKLHLAAADGTDKILGIKSLRKLQENCQKIEKVFSLPNRFSPITASTRNSRIMFNQEHRSKMGFCSKYVRASAEIDSDWNLMQSVCDLLKPLSDLSNTTQARGCTASVIIPLSHFLIEEMRKRTESPEASNAIASRIEYELSKYDDCDFLKYCTLLDNRYKDVFLKADVKDSFLRMAISEKKKEEKSVAQTDTELEVEKIVEPPQKRVKTEFELFLESKKKKKDASLTPTVSDYSVALKMELERFLSSPGDERSPVVFWTDEVSLSLYPLLSKYGQRYITCPPGSAEVERLFSTAGQILTKHRKSMSTEMFDKLLFLTKNIPLMASSDSY